MGTVLCHRYGDGIARSRRRLDHFRFAGGTGSLTAGDRIIRIGNQDISKWTDISQAVAPYSHDVVTVEIERDGQVQGVELVPEVDSASKKAMLGVMPMTTREAHGFFESAGMAVQRTGELCQSWSSASMIW